MPGVGMTPWQRQTFDDSGERSNFETPRLLISSLAFIFESYAHNYPQHEKEARVRCIGYQGYACIFGIPKLVRCAI